MKIKSLASIPFEEVISCFLSAFEGYFVQLPEDKNYWKSRFVTARVNWDLSFGMFDEEKLVGYIINGIDHHNGNLTAYNTGTGVLAEHRGKAVVDQLYEYAIPILRQEGIDKCLLEVICENSRAIRVYERIGFRITRKLSTFTGTLPEAETKNVLQKCHFSQVIKSGIYAEKHYAWDNTAAAVELMGEQVQTWCFGETSSPEAYLVMDPSGNIIQVESRNEDYETILSAAGGLAKEVKSKNVDAQRTALINLLQKWHFSNPVNQYEMEMFI